MEKKRRMEMMERWTSRKDGTNGEGSEEL